MGEEASRRFDNNHLMSNRLNYVHDKMHNLVSVYSEFFRFEKIDETAIVFSVYLV